MGRGRKAELGDIHAEMAGGKGRKFKFSVFIRPGDPRFSRGRLNHAQSRAGNGRAIRRAQNARQLCIRRRFPGRILLRGERNSGNGQHQ